jgi:hypothetical protein
VNAAGVAEVLYGPSSIWRHRRPKSLADACPVRLSEIHLAAEVLTLDGYFPVIPIRMLD